jgi:type IV pilus assembly protein PilC
MPYFKWTGIDAIGNCHRGRLFARNSEMVVKYLLNEGVAVLSVTRSLRQGKQAWTAELKASVLHQLAVLIGAGIRLREALALLKTTLSDESLVRGIITDIEQLVGQGIALSDALGHYALNVDSLMLAVIKAGERAGALGETLVLLSQYYRAQHLIIKKVKSSLFMPIVTFFFFVGICYALFALVIPRFEHLILSYGHAELPRITQLIFYCSHYVRTGGFYGIAAVIFTVGSVGVLVKVKRGSSAVQRAVLKIPIVGILMYEVALIQILQALTILLRGGIPLVHALEQVSVVTWFLPVRASILAIAYAVSSGQPFSQALSLHTVVASPELEALVKVGEASGILATMVYQAAIFYEERLMRRLEYLVSLLQPILVIGLGGLIALLMVAVYAPLMTLSVAIRY